MKLLTVRENEKVSLGHGPRELGVIDVEQLERIGTSLPRGTISWEHKGIKFGSYCGVLRTGNLTVEVLPKIGLERGSEDEARGVLVAMLRSSGVLSSAIDNPANLAKQSLHLLDVFIIDFCNTIKGLLKRGAIRSYQSYEDDLAIVRGRIRLDDQLRDGGRNQSRIHCRFDELSIDNPHNRALRSVIHKLFLCAIGIEAKRASNLLLYHFAAVSEANTTAYDIKQLTFNRLTENWRLIFERGALFLRGLYPDVRAGDTEGACLLFDMERLFESFLGHRLRAVWSRSNRREVSVVLQGPQRYLANSSRGPAFRLRPDVSLVSSGDAVQRIIDAKWKVLDFTKMNLGVTREDVYQLSVYASCYQCNKVTIVYPKSVGVPVGLVESFDFRTSEQTTVEVYTVDLVALATGYGLPKGLGPPANGA